MSELDYHTGPVTAVHSRTGLLASGGRDGTVRLWDLATSRERQRWANLGRVSSVYIAPSKLKIFAGLEGKLARMSLSSAEVNTVDLGWSCPVACLAGSSTKPNRVCMAGFVGSSIFYKVAFVQRRNTEESGAGGAGAGGAEEGGSRTGSSGTGGVVTGGSREGGAREEGAGTGVARAGVGGEGGAGAGVGAGGVSAGGSEATMTDGRVTQTAVIKTGAAGDHAREGLQSPQGSKTEGWLRTEDLGTKGLETVGLQAQEHGVTVQPDRSVTGTERGRSTQTGIHKDTHCSFKEEESQTFLQTGRMFQSEDEVFAFIESYCISHRTAFNCSSNNKIQARCRLE